MQEKNRGRVGRGGRGWVGEGRAGGRGPYLEPHDVLISEGSCKQQQR